MAMMAVDLEQGSKEWLEWRKSKVTATDVAAVVGVSPWKTPFQVYLDKIGMAPETYVNDDMKRGKDLEGEARDIINDKLGLSFKPLCVENGKYPWLGASLDGYYFGSEGSIICEIKCPKIRDSLVNIPESYMYQVQCQLLLSGSESCIFAVYEKGKEPLIHTIRPMQSLINRIVEDTCNFWYKNVLAFEAPELKSGDFYERSDAAFADLAQKWKWIQSRKRAVESEERELKQQLIESCNGVSSRGFGVSICHFPRKGSVEYSAIPSIKQMSPKELDAYRKETKMISLIREYKNG